MEEVFRYIKEEEYNKYKQTIKSGQSIIIYSDSDTDIELRKVGRKVYTFIHKYGNKKLNEVLNKICSLV